MIKNIINENLDQFGLPYGEGQRITHKNFIPKMPMNTPDSRIHFYTSHQRFKKKRQY